MRSCMPFVILAVHNVWLSGSRPSMQGFALAPLHSLVSVVTAQVKFSLIRRYCAAFTD